MTFLKVQDGGVIDVAVDAMLEMSEKFSSVLARKGRTAGPELQHADATLRRSLQQALRDGAGMMDTPWAANKLLEHVARVAPLDFVPLQFEEVKDELMVARTQGQSGAELVREALRLLKRAANAAIEEAARQDRRATSLADAILAGQPFGTSRGSDGGGRGGGPMSSRSGGYGGRGVAPTRPSGQPLKPKVVAGYGPICWSWMRELTSDKHAKSCRRPGCQRLPCRGGLSTLEFDKLSMEAEKVQRRLELGESVPDS